MEVNGRSLDTTDSTIYCKPCGDDTKRVPANGLCRDCAEHMCTVCFGNHKKYKMCKDHVLLDINATINAIGEGVKTEDDYEECALHDCEAVKFYCPKHDQVACGDCIILKHKTCDVKYIRDIASTLMDSKEGEELVQQIKHCQTKAEQCSISIKESKVQIEDTNTGCIAEIRSIRGEINEHLDKLEKSLFQKATDLKSRDEQHIAALEDECEAISKDLIRMDNVLTTQSDDPKKQFVGVVQCRHALKGIDQKLRIINTKNKINIYRFYGDKDMQRVLTECKEIGHLQIIVSTDMHTELNQPSDTVQHATESKADCIDVSLYREPVAHHSSTFRDTEDVNYSKAPGVIQNVTESGDDYMRVHQNNRTQKGSSGNRNISIYKPSSDVQNINEARADYPLANVCEDPEQSNISDRTALHYYKSPSSVKKVTESSTDDTVKHQYTEDTTLEKNNAVSGYTSLDTRYIDTENYYSELDFTSTTTREQEEQKVSMVGTKEKDKVNSLDRKPADKVISPDHKPASTVRLPVRISRKDKQKNVFEQQLRCEHILVAGEYLSYKENEGGNVGLYVGKKAAKSKSYFEIQIVSTGVKGHIAIGYVPKDYCLNQPPGVGRFSIGYHSNDGCVYDQSDDGKRIAPPCAPGDILGIGVSSAITTVFQTKIDIFFTRNGKQIAKVQINNPSMCKLYPAIAMQSAGEKIRTLKT